MAIAVIDYCKGNLLSVKRWMDAVGYDCIITDDPDRIAQADALILPGVGSFRDASETMLATGEMEVIRRRVMDDGVPFLGICLGLQLLVARGDEGCDAASAPDGSTTEATEPGGSMPYGWAEGIGALDGECVRLADTGADGKHFKIPHVGWNSIELAEDPGPLFTDVPSGSFFYFTHSYKVVPTDTGCVTAWTTYSETFPVSIHVGNIYGTQFHPEKSSNIGLTVACNFGRVVYGEGDGDDTSSRIDSWEVRSTTLPGGL